MDYYELLQVKRTATVIEIKEAYRRALLANHPDKRRSKKDIKNFDLSLFKKAYETLCSNVSQGHSEPNQSIVNSSDAKLYPSQVVSLDGFEELADHFRYACRCGSHYQITMQELEQDVHILGCEGCSETIWVAYEAIEET